MPALPLRPPSRVLCPACALLWLAVLAAALAPEAWAAAFEVRLATGTKTGTYDIVGTALVELLDAKTRGLIDAVTIPSQGSATNLELLAGGQANFALVQADTLHRAAATSGDTAYADVLRTVAKVMPEAVHVLVREGSGITSFGDIAGHSVSAGEPGSGSARTFLDVLGAYGLDQSELAWFYHPHQRAIDELLAGRLDVWAPTIAAPWASITRVLESGEARLLALEEATLTGLGLDSPTVRGGRIPRGTYPGVEEDVPTAVVPAVLVARRDVPPLVVREVLRVMDEDRAALCAAHPRGGELDIRAMAQDLPLPLHDGAVAFYLARDALELPVKVHTGIYCIDVTELDVKESTFASDFYLWFRWRGQHLKGAEEGFPFRLVNGSVNELQASPLERQGDWNYVLYRVQATLRGYFPLHRYPFDEQRLDYEVESTLGDADTLEFLEDDRSRAGQKLRDSAVHGSLAISDWLVEGAEHASRPIHYLSDLGSEAPSAKNGRTFSRYRFTLLVSRVLVPYVVKFVVPLVVIVLMSFCVFFIHPKEFEVQAGISITALLSCVAFHISQADSLPEVGYLVAADKFFLASYVIIFLTLVETVVCNHYYHTERTRAAMLVDRVSRYAFPLTFFGLLAYLTLGG